MRSSIALFLLLLGSVAQGHHLERVWTDEKGRKMKAVLLEVTEGTVVFLMPNGKETPFPLQKLSEIDKAFIEKFGLDGHTEDLVVEEAGTTTVGGGITGRTGRINPADTPENFGDPWPDRVKFEGDPQIETVVENAEEKLFVYESANYRYNCDVRLSNSVVKGFAVLFEATHQFVRELPLAINGGGKTDGKYQIFLYEKEEDYYAEGGPKGSAGVFIGGKNIVMVPLTSLGVRPVGSGYMLDRDKSSKTLPHELVHQLTPRWYYASGSVGWFTEGIAEYVAITPYRSGSFNVKTNLRPILEYVTAFGKDGNGGRNLGETIRLGSLKKFMLQPYSNFTANPQINYGCGALIATYFFQLDREKDAARIKKFLGALREGKEGEEALAVLLDGQTFDELEEEIKDALDSRGVDLVF